MPGDLYYGDCLDILRRHIANESIDLIYLDPPFNSDETYGLLHRESQAQQDAFWDSWHWDDAAREAYEALTTGGHGVPRELGEMMGALKAWLYPKHKDMLAYLAMMAIRLVEMRRALRKTGSIYLHCDPTASHYLKMVLDIIFGPECFQNEIAWERGAGRKNAAKRYGRSHDTIFFYTRSKHFTWNPQHLPFQDYSVAKNYTAVEPGTGRRYRLSDLTANKPGGDVDYEWHGMRPYKGRHWAYSRENMDKMLAEGRIVFRRTGMPVYKRYLDEMPGVSLQDIWTDIILPSDTPERVGWKTQKPVSLLERILFASSNPGDTVFDPFCGCGTTIEAAENLGRKWIGVDIAIRAVDFMKERLDAKFQPRVWKEHGEPKDIEQAERLAKNEYDFQWWAVRMLGGSPPRGEKKKGADDGVDGELRLIDDAGNVRRGLVSVKAGRNLNPDFVKTLHDNVREKKYDFGVLATMHGPTQGMRDKAADYGNVAWASGYKGKPAHKIRIITAAEWLPPNAPKWPGKIDRPRTQSSPPPPEARHGETLHLPFSPASKPRVASAKQRKQPAKTYPAPREEVRAVADSVRPSKK